VSQVPQLILNYKTGSADGISLAFLLVWLVGDITNLSGKSSNSPEDVEVSMVSPKQSLNLSWP
jgi:PQ loop repeat